MGLTKAFSRLTHRETIFKWVACQAGLSTEQIDNATYCHKNGRFLSPFTLVDVKDSSCRQVVMEWYKKEISDKGLHIHEWNTQDGMLHLQSAPGNVEHINGKIKIEPCTGTFDKLQSEPLKASMTALTNIAATPVEFKHSWKNLTIHTSIHPYIHTSIHPYILHTYIHTYYIHTYIHTYLLTYLLTYLHTYILTYLHTYILTYLHTYILTYLHTYILTYIDT